MKTQTALTRNNMPCHSFIQNSGIYQKLKKRGLKFELFLKTHSILGIIRIPKAIPTIHDIQHISIPLPVYQTHIDTSTRISNTYRYLGPYIKHISISRSVYQTHIDTSARISNTYRYAAVSIKYRSSVINRCLIPSLRFNEKFECRY